MRIDTFERQFKARGGCLTGEDSGSVSNGGRDVFGKCGRSVGRRECLCRVVSAFAIAHDEFQAL